MADKYLITKIVVEGKTGRAQLFAKGHKWPTLRLFDLSELTTVGIDPTQLKAGEEVPCRFYAYYNNSDKLNAAGNPYKNVTSLESCAPETEGDQMLRQIRDILLSMAKAQGVKVDWSKAEDTEEVSCEQDEVQSVKVPPLDDEFEGTWESKKKVGDEKKAKPATPAHANNASTDESANRINRVKRFKTPQE